jgi:mono/diheme cytochrome c family protein
MTNKIQNLFVGAAVLATALTFAGLAARWSTAAPAAASKPSTAISTTPQVGSVARGRYLVAVTGCNDCHTSGYAEKAGELPTGEWLKGSVVGYKGPWGTTYASNLRLTVQGMTEADWLVFARSPRRPPMPWFALRDMSDADLRDIYRFISSLGAAGQWMPAALDPGIAPSTPYFVFEPQTLGRSAPSNRLQNSGSTS